MSSSKNLPGYNVKLEAVLAVSPLSIKNGAPRKDLDMEVKNLDVNFGV